jgi:hypothetical protein
MVDAMGTAGRTVVRGALVAGIATDLVVVYGGR